MQRGLFEHRQVLELSSVMRRQIGRRAEGFPVVRGLSAAGQPPSRCSVLGQLVGDLHCSARARRAAANRCHMLSLT